MHPTRLIIREATAVATFLCGFWDEFRDQLAVPVRLVPVSESLRPRTKGSGLGNQEQEVGDRKAEVGVWDFGFGTWDLQRKLSAYLVLSTKYWVLGTGSG